MPSGKKEREAMRTLRATGAAAVEGMEKNVLGAESARVDIQSSLGAPGTYDLPQGLGLNAQQTATATGVDPTAANTGGLIKSEKAKSFWATQGIRPENVETLNTMDSEAVSKRVKGSAEFRIRSRMTAESEQLLARQGDLYDRFIKNQVTPVSEALGAAARESMAERKRMLSKGGAARRQAFAMESELREKESLASKKATEMSNIFTRTDDYARKYAETTLEGNTAWLNNLGGIRDDHVRLANAVHQSMLQDALPRMFEAEKANHQVRAAAYAAKRAKSMGMVKTVIGAVMTAYGMGAVGAPLMASGVNDMSGQAARPQDENSGGYGAGAGASNLLSGILGDYQASREAKARGAAEQAELAKLPGPAR